MSAVSFHSIHIMDSINCVTSLPFEKHLLLYSGVVLTLLRWFFHLPIDTYIEIDFDLQINVMNTNRVRFIDKIIFFVYQPRMIGNWNRMIYAIVKKELVCFANEFLKFARTSK